MATEPLRFDPLVLVGQTVDSACHYAFQIYLHFSGGIDLRVEGGFEISVASHSEVLEFSATNCRQAPIGQLVGVPVQRASGDVDGSLRIEFVGGAKIRCRRDPQFESYHVYDGRREYTV